jgi:serine/threonine protein kinase/tetratricopeptide (TPR) repeat protein
VSGMIKETISHYRVIKPIGAGGMGEVYLAEDTHLRRRVALKILSSSFTNDLGQLRRFEQEAHAASALNHPNIITIYEVGLDGETHFIATEFVEGETLRQHLSRAKLSLREILDIAIQVASALAASHEAGIVHRDIKPENIMLRPDGYIKVLDFGIAKLTENFTGNRAQNKESTGNPTLSFINTDSNVVLGSPSYMSPEQARGLAIDARSDIFSLGLILYEMAVNRRPFEGETSFDVIASILNKDPVPLTELSPEIPETLNQIVMKMLGKDREERYQSAVKLIHDLRGLKYRVEHALDTPQPGHSLDAYATREISVAPSVTVKDATPASLGIITIPTGSISQHLYSTIKQHKLVTGILTLVAVLTLAVFVFYPRQSLTLNERDTVLLADFANNTGDVVFDGTLRQALAVQLEQSPFLSIFSDERIRETLRYMNRSQEERLTVPVAREICQRQGLKALLTGTISSFGSHYVISLEAMNAYTGDAIARQQVEAESKEKVLTALGKATSNLREKLGESLRTVEKFDAPIEQATTSSLEALKAYSLGNEQQGRGNYLEAIPRYRRAIELDPEFALAYARLAVAYDNSRQTELAAEYATKAFEKRERVSEREKLFISWRYYSVASRELDKAIEVLELWKQTFPRNPEPPNTLSFYYSQIGQFDKAISEAREGISLSPNRTQPYSNLAIALMCLNRFDEAKAVYQQAMAQGLDSTGFHWGLYQSGFAQGDASLMQQQVSWLSGRSNEYEAVDWQAKTSAFAGQLTRAKEFSNHAIDLAERGNLKEVAAQFTTHAALREAITGKCQTAPSEVSKAIALAKTNTTVVEGAFVLALCGDSNQAMNLLNEQYKRYPKDTLLNMIWLPTVKAIIELRRNNPAGVIPLLQPAQQYESGYIAAYWPTYIRGLAYLKMQQGQQAATEFQKILSSGGVNMNTNLYSLARLGLARALAISGNQAESRKAYEEFLRIWKDADANIPVLQEARAEYEKLKQGI